jgi:pimeloyl-ACP methyl ester carboxylesterase
MTSPRWIDVHAPAVELKALTWGPPDGPIALCLHGFPDTAYGWRNFAPRLAESGWRVVAPFMRGYAPSSIPSDGSYHLGALMDDALQVRSAAGGTDRDVVIGHDWGAMAANGLAAMPDSPSAESAARSGSAARSDPASVIAQLVHHVLPIALAARAIRVLGAAEAVEAMVTGLQRQRRSAPCRRRDRDTGELACRARALPCHHSQYPPADALRQTAPALDIGTDVAEPLLTRPR